MHKILIVMDVLDEHREIFNNVSSELEVKYVLSDSLKPEDLEDAEMIIGNLNPNLLANCKNLKLLQLNFAGTDGFVGTGVIPQGALLANASGAYGPAMSEYMLGMLLSLMKKLNIYRLNQEKHEWKDEGNVTTIFGTKTLVVGFGDIGSEFGIRMNALGSRVTGIRNNISRKPDFVESMHTMDDLYECLENADIIASSLPSYKKTYKIFNKEAFSHMKDGAYFINVGRGTAVDTDALCDALESGKLAGAAVDVTDPEPLPPNHRLWTLPNVIITPHVSGGYHVKESHDRIVKIAVKNMLHLVNNEPFENLVDMTTGYRINP